MTFPLMQNFRSFPYKFPRIFWSWIFAFNFPGVIDIWVIKDEVASNLPFLIGQYILANNENICRETFIG